MAFAAASSGAVRQVEVLLEFVELQAKVAMSKAHERGVFEDAVGDVIVLVAGVEDGVGDEVEFGLGKFACVVLGRMSVRVWRGCLHGRLLTAVRCAFHRKLNAR